MENNQKDTVKAINGEIKSIGTGGKYSAGAITLVSLLEKNNKVIYNGGKIMGDVYMSATDVIKGILKDKEITQVELAEKTKVTKQNLSNKMNRDNFSTLELVEIADALDMQLLLKNNSDGKEYVIDYPEEVKGKPKRARKSQEE